MTAESPETTRKRRGTGFPLFALPDAVKMAVEIGHHGNEHAPAAAAAYLGHETDNSGAFRSKLAALRDWALITRSNDRIVLTHLGTRFAMSDSPLDERASLIEAFRSCKVFAQTYDNVARDVPLTITSLRKRAVLEYGVSTEQADRFVNSLIASATAAGLATSNGETVTFTAAGQPEPEALDEVEAVTASPVLAPPTAAARTQIASSTVPTLLRQSWPISGGEVILTITGSNALSAGVFAPIAEVVAAAERLAKAIGQPPGDGGEP